MYNLDHNKSFRPKNILFLGYGKEKTKLISELKKNNCNVKNKSTKAVLSDLDNIDLVISYGYRHTLKISFINHKSIPIINLHISYLPWNRGAHPNFWAFYDNTPIGLTIHLIDEGIDTGPILFQKKVKFLQEKTFSQTYQKLFFEIEQLFIKNIQSILDKSWVEKPQKNFGTFHTIKDLPKDFKGWESNIVQEIARLKNN